MSVVANAQIADLLNAFDSGGRAMGVGGSTRVTDASTNSALDNPAGLAYVGDKSFGMNIRTMPESQTIASGDLNDRTNVTANRGGKYGLTHVGYTMPFKKGTLGVSYTVGGYIKNRTAGNNLNDGGLSARNLVEETTAQTDYFAISYGERKGTQNIGYGLVIANQYVRSTQDYQLFNGNTQVGTVSSDNSGNGLGVGIVAGIQGDVNQDMVWGASVRTPIDISGNGSSSAIYDRIPGKLSAGVAARRDGYFGDQDYMIWSVQADYYFGGQRNKVISRKDVLAGSFGLEYNMFRNGVRYPVRFGYAFVPGGGDGYSDRNSWTFGLGYRPNNADYTVDLSFAKANGGGPFDVALGLTYKPKN
ncbi:MAG: hypothetical protein R2688_01710 [Fimbriimonadaceae bacterium]